MTSPPSDSTHGRTTSGVACNHRLWAAHTIERRQALHAIIAFGQHKWLNDVGRGLTSPPLDNTHGRQRRAWHAIAAFGQHTRSDVRRDMPAPPLDNTHGRTMSGVACHHRLWAAHTVERHRAWHDITAFGQQHGRTTSGMACHHRL